MLNQVAKDIKELRIQGATNIAFAGLVALRHVISKASASNKNSFIKSLDRARDLLFSARPNEPMLYNAVNHVIEQLECYDGSDLKGQGLKFIERLEDQFSAAKKQMFKAGKGLIANGSIVFTHCHASSVMGVIKDAKPHIKRVYCTESRPRYQGRITAKELVKAKIPTTMVVDSAVADYIKKSDFFLIGCDVISTTHIINKIGSRMISLLCEKYDVPLYVCSLSYKFDPECIEGLTHVIEERDTKEVWDKPPRGLKIRNPAFDVVDFDNITGFITEHGVLPPTSFVNKMTRKKGNVCGVSYLS